MKYYWLGLYALTKLIKHCILLSENKWYYQKNIVYFSLKNDLVRGNCANPDEMLCSHRSRKGLFGPLKMNLFLYPSITSCVMGAQKNCLILVGKWERYIFSTHSYLEAWFHVQTLIKCLIRGISVYTKVKITTHSLDKCHFIISR